jgi:hypothetical protein
MVTEQGLFVSSSKNRWNKRVGAFYKKRTTQTLKNAEIGRPLRRHTAIRHVGLTQWQHARTTAIHDIGQVQQGNVITMTIRGLCLNDIRQHETNGRPGHEWFATKLVGQGAQKADPEKGEKLVDRFHLATQGNGLGTGIIVLATTISIHNGPNHEWHIN